MEYIKESKALLSLHHNEFEGLASFEIVDVKNGYKKIYCHEIVKGSTHTVCVSLFLIII